MKIVVIASNPPGWAGSGHLGGAERRVQEIARRWHSAGHEVHVIEGPAGPSAHPPAPWASTSIPLPPWDGSVLAARRSSRLFVRQVEAVASGLTVPDAIVAATSTRTDVRSALSVSQLTGAPWGLVVAIDAYADSFMGTWRRMRRDSGPLVSAARAWSGVQVLRMARSASWVFCIAPPIAEPLRAWVDPEKLHVTGMGVDRMSLDRVDGDEEPSGIAFVGRVEEGKGIHDALEVTRSMGETLHVIGDGAARPEATRRAQDMGITDQVVWHGFLPGPERFKILKSARALVFPSRTEGYGLAVAESLACGVPVALYANVARNFPDAPGVFSAVDGDVGGLARATRLAMDARNDPAFVAAAKRFVDLLSWDAVAAREAEIMSAAARRVIG